jgi:multicomponent Na+:H+ antiporter subunit B
MTAFVDLVLLGLLAVTGIGLLRLRNLFAVVILSGIYSLLSAGLFVTMDAPDVAFTESAVGVGISTVLMLGALALVGHDEAPGRRSRVLPLAVVTVTGVILLYGIGDIPPYGDPTNPIHHHVVPRYLEEQPEEIGVSNVVSAVLASYRGYDTMGETAVIFTAGVGVLILLGGSRRNSRREDGR